MLVRITHRTGKCIALGEFGCQELLGMFEERRMANGKSRQQNMHPVIRGRKLVFNYTDGSPCPEVSKHSRRSDNVTGLEIVDGDKPDEPEMSSTRRKTTIISMLCDRDPLAHQLVLSFIASPDECTYIFEARSPAACAGIEQAKQTLSPSGVFGVIALIAVIVYVVGGCVYSRVVLQQRGWKQLPNYNLWAGIFSFFRVCSSSTSLCPIVRANPLRCRTFSSF